MLFLYCLLNYHDIVLDSPFGVMFFQRMFTLIIGMSVPCLQTPCDNDVVFYLFNDGVAVFTT